MAAVFFFIAATGAVGGALGTVLLRNAFYSVLALVCHLISLAALFLLLRAEFVAAAQVIVYAGAVMVLYVFVVAYIGGIDTRLAGRSSTPVKILSTIFAGALLLELMIAVLGSGLKALDAKGAPYRTGFGTPRSLGQALLTTYLAAFEIASILLLVAAVGAVILARRRTGLADVREVSVADVMRGDITAAEAEPETMLEAGGPPQR